MYQSVGVFTTDGMPILTKKALKAYVADGDVRFYRLFSVVEPHMEGYTVVPTHGVKLSVVGPDPYTNRKWYATVEVNATGQVKVS